MQTELNEPLNLPVLPEREPDFRLEEEEDFYLLRATLFGFAFKDLRFHFEPRQAMIWGRGEGRGESRDAFIRTMKFPKVVAPDLAKIELQGSELIISLPKATSSLVH